MLLYEYTLIYIQGVEAKLGIFKYNNNKQLSKNKIHLNLKNKQQNKIDTNSKFTQYGCHFFQLMYQHTFKMICMTLK